MKDSFAKIISLHLEDQWVKDNNATGIIIFKPGYSKPQIKDFLDFCVREDLNILDGHTVILSKETSIALYPKIFSFSKDDLKFGVGWKKEIIAHLTSGQSSYFLVRGSDAIKKLTDYKYKLREKHGKITDPRYTMSKKKFVDKVVKNLVHVIDEEELQNALWLLFSNEKN